MDNVIEEAMSKLPPAHLHPEDEVSVYLTRKEYDVVYTFTKYIFEGVRRWEFAGYYKVDKK